MLQMFDSNLKRLNTHKICCVNLLFDSLNSIKNTLFYWTF